MKSKSDSQIRHEVESELYWDTRTWNLGIKVTVKKGLVKLSGKTPTYAQKIAAQNAAHKVLGVLDVVNDITVKSPRFYGDSKIAQTVRQALEWDVLIPDERIRSTVADGVVTLEGEVHSLQQKQDAERAIENLAGVQGVINKISVQEIEVDPEELRVSIESALARRAHREAERFRLDIKAGEVDIYGRSFLARAGSRGRIDQPCDRRN